MAYTARGIGKMISIVSIVAIAPETLNGVYGGTKAYVMALSRSLHHELADKGVRVQAGLPSANATGFLDITGGPPSKLPPKIVMPLGEMVGAAPAGLDLWGFCPISALPGMAG